MGGVGHDGVGGGVGLVAKKRNEISINIRGNGVETDPLRSVDSAVHKLQNAGLCSTRIPGVTIAIGLFGKLLKSCSMNVSLNIARSNGGRAEITIGPHPVHARARNARSRRMRKREGERARGPGRKGGTRMVKTMI